MTIRLKLSIHLQVIIIYLIIEEESKGTVIRQTFRKPFRKPFGQIVNTHRVNRGLCALRASNTYLGNRYY